MEYRGRLTFAIAQEKDYQVELEQLGMDNWGEDVMAVLWAAPAVRYRYEDSFTTSGMTKFVEASSPSVVANHC